MTEVAERLKSELAQLSPQEREEIAYFLLHSLGESGIDDDAAWEAELDRRMAEMDSGKDPGEPAEKVFSELRKKYS